MSQGSLARSRCPTRSSVVSWRRGSALVQAFRRRRATALHKERPSFDLVIPKARDRAKRRRDPILNLSSQRAATERSEGAALWDLLFLWRPQWPPPNFSPGCAKPAQYAKLPSPRIEWRASESNRTMAERTTALPLPGGN